MKDGAIVKDATAPDRSFRHDVMRRRGGCTGATPVARRSGWLRATPVARWSGWLRATPVARWSGWLRPTPVARGRVVRATPVVVAIVCGACSTAASGPARGVMRGVVPGTSTVVVVTEGQLEPRSIWKL
jgi:hypothetical protein